VIMAVLMALGGAVFALTDQALVLVIGAFTGTISVTSSEVGVFQTVEQAVLPQTAPDERRTWLFSIYNTVANFAQAIGSQFEFITTPVTRSGSPGMPGSTRTGRSGEPGV